MTYLYTHACLSCGQEFQGTLGNKYCKNCCNKNCIICKKSFQALRFTIITCSSDCRKIHYANLNREYRKNHRDIVNKAAKKYRSKNPEKRSKYDRENKINNRKILRLLKETMPSLESRLRSLVKEGN